jgi:hypothetical protein
MAPSWLDVLDETIRVCVARDRPDLAGRLQQKRGRLLDPKLRVLVIGEPRQGKSQLVNALINAPVCAVGDDITTTVPTLVQHAEIPSAVLVRQPAWSPLQIAGAAGSGPEKVPVPIDEVAGQVGGRTGGLDLAEYVRAEIGIPRALLASGLVLIDTPGIAELDSTRGESALAALAQADAALMVSDATHELSATELELLALIVRACPNVIVALTKIDLAPQWRLVAERNREHLARAGVPAALIPVSATLRLRAALTNDTSLNAESGFPDLLGHLQRDVITNADGLARRAVAVTTRTTVEQLVAPMHADLSADGATPPSAEVAELQVAQHRLGELRRRSARWQNILTDEISDLMADVDYDLRDRTRKILQRVDEIFEKADPAQVWDTFSEWLLENLSEAAEANFAWLIDRSDWIARTIAATFPLRQEGIFPESTFAVPRDMFDCITRPDEPTFEKFTATQKLHSGLRGSYGGVLMAGLITSLAGMPILNGVSIGVGTVFGGKALRDEGEARLKRRQAVAKAAVQRHVDDFFLKFGKDCRDITRRVQRRLRDHFTALTEELQEHIVESARIAKQAIDSDTLERSRRRQELRRELEELVALDQRAQALAAPQPAPGPAGAALAASTLAGPAPRQGAMALAGQELIA